MALVFTNLSREFPEKEFRCELTLEDRKYRVHHCSPQVEKASNGQWLLMRVFKKF